MTTIEQVIKEMRECGTSMIGEFRVSDWASRLDAELRRGPVAWMQWHPDGRRVFAYAGESRTPCLGDWRESPLFAAPQPAIPDWRPIDGERHKVLLEALETLGHVEGMSDADEACIRVCRRRIAEVLGLPLDKFRLLMEPSPLQNRYVKTPPSGDAGKEGG